ncbi:MAG: ThuA domain-containing protein [Clostridiales bacterium]|jgi:trehalose utilization protein|nr:ThuA domain-containing protein [Clostridiales bacterium]
MGAISVTVWNEFLHEKSDPAVAAVYPDGIHGCIAKFLSEAGFDTRTATLREPQHGLSDEVLEKTDVLIWWGHMAHGEVADETVEKAYRRVQDGMGLVVLHSGHESKLFKRLLGTDTGRLKWREIGEKEIVWIIDRTHPIAEGIDEKIVIPREEMYGEPFGIPAPDELVFASWFEGGEIFRSGCCFKRGKGRIFYFRPGHESFPVYHMPEIQTVVKNAVRWAKAPFIPSYVDGHTPKTTVEIKR